MPPTSSAVSRLGTFIATAPRGHSDLALGRAQKAFLDTIGCMLLGAPSDPARITSASIATWWQGNAVTAATSRTAPATCAQLDQLADVRQLTALLVAR